jgi:hypothetical protein
MVKDIPGETENHITCSVSTNSIVKEVVFGEELRKVLAPACED